MFWISPGIGACGMDHAIPVIGRSVESVELEWRCSSIDDVVLGASWHQYGKARADRCFHTIEYGFPVTSLNPKKLIEFVNFDSDILPDLQRHKDELAIRCRVKNRSECDIRFAESFNVCYKSAQSFIPNFR